MKNHLKIFILGSILTFMASCDSSSDSPNNTNTNDLKKVVTIRTNSGNTTYNTRNVKRYVNFQVVSDSTFDYQDQFMYRNVITTEGMTKTYKTYLNTGELSEHREENYDSQGRLVGRHTYLPPSALYFTYAYNNDGTVTSKYYNELDGETISFRTFTKNADGLLSKNNYSAYSLSTGQVENYESTANLQGQKLVSVTYDGQTTMGFEYYSNPMPANLLKSVNQLNNLIVMGNDLSYLAYNGNAYYKQNDEIITTFNSDNYKTYVKSVYTNTTATPNVTSTVEQFYYYE
ncbi:MAG: hypothetical protein QM710_06250 [Flavobacterium sp.]